MGKVLSHPSLFNLKQWTVVGDTFPVCYFYYIHFLFLIILKQQIGCEFSKSIIYHDYFEFNKDNSNPTYNTKYGIYQPNCGIDNVLFSFGHDEYLYQVCVQNGCLLPPEALFIIRYHSCYAIHQKSAYTHLMNNDDFDRLKWLKEFQKFDLYSKLPDTPNVQLLLPYYQKVFFKKILIFLKFINFYLYV